MKEWITVKEAALLVGRAPRTIYRERARRIASCKPRGLSPVTFCT